jgi:Flp pilus assembly protein TadD
MPRHPDPVRRKPPTDSAPLPPRKRRGNSHEQRLITLLEALFTHLPSPDQGPGPAADLLLDTYLDAASPRKAEQFLAALRETPSAGLRALGWQRQCALDAARGRLSSAWAAFHEATRLNPAAPALACLEVSTLMAEGRRDEARHKAGLWAARLASNPARDFSDLIAHLHDMARHDPAVLTDAGSDDGRVIERILLQIDAWPAPTCHYRLRQAEALAPDPALARLEARWAHVSPFNDAAAPGAWLDMLLSERLCGESFLILNDMAEMMQQAPVGNPASARALIRALLLRGEALRRVVLADLQATDHPLPWQHPGNQPVLCLTADHARHFSAPGDDTALVPLRWSVRVANPSDETGLRDLLVHSLASCGHAAEALVVAEHAAPDDTFSRHGRVLALFALGQRDDARQALRECQAGSPQIWKTLSARAPRKPKMNPGVYAVGGRDEAWIYRQAYLEYWTHAGALAWATES